MLGHAAIPTAWVPRPVTILKWIVYLAVPFALWLVHNYETLTEYFTARAHRDQNKIEVTTLEREYTSLLHEKRQLEVGGFATEKAIRERLLMVRPGERVMFIEEPKAGAGEPDSRPDAREDRNLAHPASSNDSAEAAAPAVSPAPPAKEDPQSTPRVDLGAEPEADPGPAPSLEEILKRPIANPDLDARSSESSAPESPDARPATATIRVTR